jgi:hypothetical protein
MSSKRSIVTAAVVPVAALVLAAAVGCGGGTDIPANYRDGELPAGAAAKSEAAAGQENRLVGTAWKLLAVDPPDRSIIFMDDPDRYLLQFKSETVVAVKADCNACEGRYQSTGRALVVQIDCVTQGCRPGSYGEYFLSIINTVSSFSMSGSGKELYINYGAERGTMTLRRL